MLADVAFGSSPQQSRSRSFKPTIHHCTFVARERGRVRRGLGLLTYSCSLQLCVSMKRCSLQKISWHESHLPMIASLRLLHTGSLGSAGSLENRHCILIGTPILAVVM